MFLAELRPRTWRRGVFQVANLKGFPQQAPCVPLRYALPNPYAERLYQSALSEAGSTERETGQVRFCNSVNAMPPDAGDVPVTTWCVSAQLVDGFGVCMAVRGGGPLVLGELARKGPTHPQALFLLYRVRHVFFLARQKENVGDILMGKAHLPAAKPHIGTCSPSRQYDSRP